MIDGGCRKLCFYYKIPPNNCQIYLTELLPDMKTSCYSFRSNHNQTVPKVRTGTFHNKIPPLAPVIGTNSTQAYKILLQLKFLSETTPTQFYLS